MLLANSNDDNDDNDDSSTLSSIHDFLYIITTTTPSAVSAPASASEALLITNRYLSFIARIIIAKTNLKNSRRRINNIKNIHTPTISSRHCRRRRRRHRTSNCHHHQNDHQQLQDIQHQQEQEQEQLQQQHQQHQQHQHQQKQRRRRRIIHTPPPPHYSMLFRRLYNQQSIVVSLLTFISVVPSLTVAVMATTETEPSSSPTTTTEESISLNLPVDAASRSLALLLLLLNIDGEDGEDDDNDNDDENNNDNDNDNDDNDDIDEWERESILQTHLINTDDDYKNTYNRNNNIGDDDDDDGDNNDSYHPFLVICTVDGDILVLNALDGSLICSFNSGLPLVGASEPLHDDDDDDDDDADHDNNHEKDEDRFGDGDDDYYQRQIVPGLDGQLYVTASDGFLKPLEITVLDVLANPVKTCKSNNNNNNNNNNNSNSNNNNNDNGDSDSDDGSSTANNNSDKDNDDNNSNYDDNGDHNSIECGIVTATKSTSLFALDATSGTLVWHQHPNGTTLKMDYNDDDDYDYNDEDIGINNDDDIDIDIGSSSTRQRTNKRQQQKRKKESQQTKTTVLLQREDVIVQQISTSTGASVWNVTLGTLQALEFGGDTGGGRRGGSTSQGRGSMDDEYSNQLTSSPATNEQRGLLPTGEETENNGNNNEYNNDNNNNRLSTKLPKVIFSGDGTSLTAVHPSSGNNKVMWSREFPTTVASVFGLNGKSWEPLTVLDEHALLPENDIDSDQSFDLALINQFNNNDDGKEFSNSFHTELLINHGGRGDRDRLFQNAIRQHRRRQQSPPLLPSFSSSSKSMMFITSNDNGYLDDGIYYPSPSHHYKHQLELPSPTDYQELRRLFCLLPNSMCLSMGTQGLFLRWPIVLLATLCVAAIAIVTYRRFYEQFKKKEKEKRSKQMKRWEELRMASMHSRVSRNSRASRVSFLDDDDSNHQVHSADNADLYGDLDCNDKLNSHIPPRSPQPRRRPRRASFAISSPMVPDSNPINNAIATGNKEKNNNNDSDINIVSANGLIRSRSMPGNMDQHQRMPMVQMTPVNLNNERISPYGSPKVDGIAAIASPPAMLPLEAQSSHGVGLIDGTIPLIQYTRYASEFEEIGALGKGGFGSVFQCRNALDKRDYAIKKVLIRCDAKLPQIEFSRRLKRTLREVKSLASLDHSNIVRYYTAWLELEQANHNDNNHSVVGPCSDYYLMSPSLGNDFSENRSPTWKKNILTNPFGSGGGLPSVLDHSFSTSRDDDCVIPGISEELDDIGFVFDRSEGEKPCTNPDLRKVEATIDESTSKIDALFPRSNRLNYGTAFQSFRSSQSSVEESSVGWSRESLDQSDATGEENKSKSNSATKESTTAAETSTSQRYILYIQMQFCSQKTLADFLSNEEARKGPSGSSIGGVDIPYALNLFLQTCQGVKHVHTQCLIHRDLKPNNVFIDDTGAVKVGDFGLSRESSDNSGESEAEPALTGAENYSYNGDITAGVGTRSYASPEQMKGGSDYDSSTDIYSLGIILFELCFPMYTGMERNIVLTKLRNHILPDQWMESVAVDFPKLHTLLLSMISNKPEDRPDAAAVVRTVQSILEGFTISSLDRRDYEGSILLRVETLFRENGLHQTMDLLRQAALPVLIDIVQYGLRSGTNQGEMKSIMEFAIVPQPQQEEKDATKCSPSSIGELLVKTLNDNPQVLLIRQVSATKYT